jgi:hypothetical protein
MASASSVGSPPLVVEAGTQLRVQAVEDAVTVRLGGRDADADRSPGSLEALAVVVGDVLLGVQMGKAHHVEAGLDVANLLNLFHPARGHPGPRAEGVEPEVGNSGLLGH